MKLRTKDLSINFEIRYKNMQDTYRHKGLRRQMVDEVQKKRTLSNVVIEALMDVPRHLFLDSSFEKHAYEDKAFQIGAGQTISQPNIVALQSELLEVEKGDKILEIGTGSGYQCAVLVAMGAKVFSIERQRELYLKTKKLLDKLSYRARLQYGDGYKGWPTFAPFDGIIVTCGAPEVPEALLSQLKMGGRLVVPVGDGPQEMLRITKTEDGYKTEKFGGCAFVPMLENVAK